MFFNPNCASPELRLARIAPREYAVRFTRAARSTGLICKSDVENHGIKEVQAHYFRAFSVFRGYRLS